MKKLKMCKDYGSQNGRPTEFKAGEIVLRLPHSPRLLKYFKYYDSENDRWSGSEIGGAIIGGIAATVPDWFYVYPFVTSWFSSEAENYGSAIATLFCMLTIVAGAFAGVGIGSCLETLTKNCTGFGIGSCLETLTKNCNSEEPYYPLKADKARETQKEGNDIENPEEQEVYTNQSRTSYR